MTTTDDVTVTTVVAVDPATAFEVFTNEIDAWWKTGPRFRVNADRKSAMRFEGGVGGRLLEVYDDASDDAFEHGRILVWEPADRLVFQMGGRDFQPGESTEVEVRFETAEQGTRVTVEHRGWDRFPKGHRVRHGLEGSAFRNLMGVWWGDLLVSLRQEADRSERDA